MLNALMMSIISTRTLPLGDRLWKGGSWGPQHTVTSHPGLARGSYRDARAIAGAGAAMPHLGPEQQRGATIASTGAAAARGAHYRYV